MLHILLIYEEAHPQNSGCLLMISDYKIEMQLEIRT